MNVRNGWKADTSYGKSTLVPQIKTTIVTLRFGGDDLDPLELSKSLNATPTLARVKGVRWKTASGDRVAKTGQWHVKLEAEAPDNFEKLVARLFGLLIDERSVWLDLSQRFSGNLFVGLFMESSNDGVSIKRKTLDAIASRGLELGFDIYSPTEE